MGLTLKIDPTSSQNNTSRMSCGYTDVFAGDATRHRCCYSVQIPARIRGKMSYQTIGVWKKSIGHGAYSP
jgi:hypothetical protein